MSRIDNLSIGGCLLPLSAEFNADTPCTLNILMTGTSSELSVKVDGRISRSRKGAIAVKFSNIDLDSLFHLKNIIRYNAKDPDAVDSEIFDTAL